MKFYLQSRLRKISLIIIRRTLRGIRKFGLLSRFGIRVTGPTLLTEAYCNGYVDGYMEGQRDAFKDVLENAKEMLPNMFDKDGRVIRD